MTNEDKSKQYAQSVIDSFGVSGVPNSIKDIRQMIADGYLAGATEAFLATQWKRPEDELPSSSHALTFIMTNSGCQLEIANWLNGKFGQQLVIYMTKRWQNMRVDAKAYSTLKSLMKRSADAKLCIELMMA